MKDKEGNHNETIIDFFDGDLRWWSDVYRDDLPRGFFSFEMRRRLQLVSDLLTAQIEKMDNPDVLECGCGPGDILALLAPLRCRLTGLDLNQRYLDMAAEKIPGAMLINGNAESLPFPDASFDIVYAVGVLPYLSDDRTAAKEIARVTRDGGFVLISVPNYRMLHLLLNPYYIFRSATRILSLEKKQPTSGFDESKMRRYPLPRLRRLVREFDLHEIRSMSTSYGPLKFWRSEVFPLATSIRLSETLRKWSDRKWGAALRRVGNHFIITLRKGSIPTGEVRP
jgi:ubiquinone/menaquinone biosynthesis C-methylase UbiE